MYHGDQLQWQTEMEDEMVFFRMSTQNSTKLKIPTLINYWFDWNKCVKNRVLVTVQSNLFKAKKGNVSFSVLSACEICRAFSEISLPCPGCWRWPGVRERTHPRAYLVNHPHPLSLNYGHSKVILNFLIKAQIVTQQTHFQLFLLTYSAQS